VKGDSEAPTPYSRRVRIIGGTLRGRRIRAPDGNATRPMLDRVREAMFSTLAPWIDDDARVLDLFAGSGSLGLEALSRGAAFVRFVERGDPAVGMLKQNARDLGIGDRTQVSQGDALSAVAWDGEGWADVVFFDPPYPLLGEPKARPRVLAALHGLVRRVLAPEGVLVFHAPRGAVLSADFEPDLVVRERVYGRNSLWYVQLEDPGEAEGGA